MNLQTAVGAHLVVGFAGTALTPDSIKLLSQIQPQSLILFSRNVESPTHLCELLQQVKGALGYRVVVMVDHEGGRIIRFGQGVTRFADAFTAGQAGSESVEQQGAIEAAELQRLGVHLNLAPCVDVLVPGADLVIGDRSYGADPNRVATLAVARIRGLQANGVGACAKHFPGLGAVPKDPHRHLPTIELEWPEIEQVHLVPFRASIKARVATVMSSHVCYPGLGEPVHRPATFSSELIHGVLRSRLGFSGLILTDDVEMGALRHLGTLGEAAVQAVAAGHDLVLVCSDLEQARQAAEQLRIAYEHGRLRLTDLEATQARLSKFKQKFLPDRP